MHIRDLGRTGQVGVDDHEFGGPFFARFLNVCHDVDLGGSRVPSPTDD